MAITLTLVLLLAAPAVFAADASGPGRDLTKAKCKSCHYEGSTAGTMTPLSKTQKQWERFFEKSQHEKKAPGKLQGITDKEMELIREYLFNHSADSPHPETCG
jgi:cytochrome c5